MVSEHLSSFTIPPKTRNKKQGSPTSGTLPSEMAANKDRLDLLERNLGHLQDEMQKLQVGVTEKLSHIEATLNRLMESMTNSQEGTVSAAKKGKRPDGDNRSNTADRTDQRSGMFHSKFFKLEFSRFSGGDPTSWLSKTRQFFAYQDTPDDHRVQYAAYHLEDEAMNGGRL